MDECTQHAFQRVNVDHCREKAEGREDQGAKAVRPPRSAPAAIQRERLGGIAIFREAAQLPWPKPGSDRGRMLHAP